MLLINLLAIAHEFLPEAQVQIGKDLTEGLLVGDAGTRVEKLLQSVARRIPDKPFKSFGHRHITLPHRKAEHLLQRPGEGVASFGFLQGLETETDGVGGGWILRMLPDEGVAEVDSAEKLKR